MLRLRDGQAELFDSVMPAEVRTLSPELAAVDQLLDDERFLEPFVARFACSIGRPAAAVRLHGDGGRHSIPNRLWAVRACNRPDVASGEGSEGGGIGVWHPL